MRDSLGNSKLGFIISHCAEPARLIRYHTQFESRSFQEWFFLGAGTGFARAGKHNFRIHMTSAKI